VIIHDLSKSCGKSTVEPRPASILGETVSDEFGALRAAVERMPDPLLRATLDIYDLLVQPLRHPLAAEIRAVLRVERRRRLEEVLHLEEALAGTTGELVGPADGDLDDELASMLEIEGGWPSSGTTSPQLRPSNRNRLGSYYPGRGRGPGAALVESAGAGPRRHRGPDPDRTHRARRSGRKCARRAGDPRRSKGSSGTEPVDSTGSVP